MNINKMVALAALAFLFSCSDENSLSSLTNDEKELSGQMLTSQELKVLYRLQKPNSRVSIEEAMQIANEFKASMNRTDSIASFYKSDPILESIYRKNPVVKIEMSKEELSVPSIEVKSVSAMLLKDNSIKKRGVEIDGNVDIPDTLAHILNFGDDKGFAIISADTRIEASVLAFTTQGSYNRQTDNPGMALYLEMLDAYLINSITKAEYQKDSLINNILSKLDVENIEDIGDIANINSGVLPRVTVNYDCTPNHVCIEEVTQLVEKKWGQRWPYNDSIETPNVCTVQDIIDSNNYGSYNPGGRYLTGCVATATAQIMSYYRYPDLYTASNLSLSPARLGWDNLSQTSYGFYMYNYNPSNSYAMSIRNWLIAAVARVFKIIGTNVSMVYGCNGSGTDSQEALNYLSSLGYTVSALNSYNYTTAKNSLGYGRLVYSRGCAEGCHAWVIDGYREITDNTGWSQKFLYNNWGWNGLYDGLFPAGVFNPSNNYQTGLKIASVYK